jgi:hypothetical protein
MFVVAFVGQTLVAVSQVFILSFPARLAAVWFGPNEVSSACSIGVFGNQVSASVDHLSLVPGSGIFHTPAECIQQRCDARLWPQ